MRRLGDGVEAALHCAAVLAELPEGKVLSGRDLAALHGVSESYLL
ncbi:MAG TPA: transcriptional regulator, partial [Ruegeria sp.]|nr:transcriptional regulator [Ruegeria sp.]